MGKAAGFFKRSTLTPDALRKAEPLPTAAIVAYVAEAIGQPNAAKGLAKTVATNLRYMATRHRMVVKSGDRKTTRWARA